MIRSAQLMLPPDGVTSTDTRTGVPLTFVVTVADGEKILHTSAPPANVAPVLSPAAGTDSANRTTVLVGVAAEETFAVIRAPLNCGSASDPAKLVPSAAKEGVPAIVAAAPAPISVTNTVELLPSSIAQAVAGTLVPVSWFGYRV